LGLIYNYKTWKNLSGKNSCPLFTAEEFLSAEKKSDELNFVVVNGEVPLSHPDKNVVFIFETRSETAMTDLRKMFFDSPPSVPIIIKREYSDVSPEQFQLFSATDVGGLLVDGLGDGVWLAINNKQQTTNNK